MEYKSIYNKQQNISNKQPHLKNPKNLSPLLGNAKFLLGLSIITLFAIIGAIAGLYFAFSQEVPEIADLKNYKPNLSTSLYDANSNLVSQLYTEQRTLTRLSDVPLNLQNAIIAKEDPRFYQHAGFDLKGIMRATINNLAHGKVVEGGSTITQQLARNLFLSGERTFARKIKEALLALQIEKYYTKKEILELYCNQVYFGNGAYGVEAAARVYFGKHANDLTLEECAMLAALPQAPSQFNPYKYPEIAKEKRDIVLEKMAQQGFITEEEKEEAQNKPITLSRLEVKNAPYFIEYVRQKLETTYGSNILYNGGLRVYTTIDTVLQTTAQEVFNYHIKKLTDRVEKLKGKKLDKPLQGAMIGIDPQTGHIKLMIGGIDFSQNEFNRAVQAKRQTGSAFKPIIYACALENGFRLSDIIIDSPIVFTNEDGSEWKPENFSGKFLGPTTLINGLTHSINIVTVKLLNKLGTKTVAAFARKLGIESPLSNDLTMALGSSSLSLLELTASFCPFANGGMRVEPVAIIEVKDANGKTLEQNIPKMQEAISETTAYLTTYMLENVINKGTGREIRNMGLKIPCAGKTGSTNDYTDAWFIGYTPNFVLGIWIGFDDKETMGKNMVGGTVAAPIWAEFMLNAFPEINQDFPVPDNIIFKKICSKSGGLATQFCPTTLDVPFISGTEPTQNCKLHSQIQASDFLNQDMEDYEISDADAYDKVDGEMTLDTTTQKSTKKQPSSTLTPTKNTKPVEDTDGLGF